jgi:hypothetical protein
MTTRQKTRKAPAAKAADPIFAAIAEHKRLAKELARYEVAFNTVRGQAEKRHGVAEADSSEAAVAALKLACADTSLEYELMNRADRDARKGGMRLARTKPTTLAGVAALAAYLHRNYTDEINEDWAEVSFKVVASVLTRMSKEAACAIH